MEPNSENKVCEYLDRKKNLSLYSYFVFWGQNSYSRNGGYVYDSNQMTWSSVYGPNGFYPQNQESDIFDNGYDYYGPDYNFDDGDW